MKRRASRALRIAAKTLLALVCVPVGLLVGVAASPDWLIGAGLATGAHALLGTPEIGFDGFELDLLDGLDVSGLRIGPPEGFSRDVLRAERLELRYQPRALLSGELRVTRLSLWRPSLALERRGARLNLTSLTDRRSSDHDKGGLRIVVDAFGVTGAQLSYVDRARRARLVGLSAHGALASGGSGPGRLRGSLALLPRVAGGANLELEAGSHRRLDARAVLGAELSLRGLRTGQPRGRLQATLAITPRRFSAVGGKEVAVEPLSLSLRGRADSARQTFALERARFTLGEHTRLRGRSSARKTTELRYRVDLAGVARYVALLVPGIALAGDVRGRLELPTSAIGSLFAGRLPHSLEARTRARRLMIETGSIAVRDADLRLELERGPDAPSLSLATDEPLAAKLRASAGSLAIGRHVLRGLAMRATAAARIARIRPERFAAVVRARTALVLPQHRRLPLMVRGELRGSSHGSSLALERIALRWPRYASVRGSARVSDLDLARKHVEAHLVASLPRLGRIERLIGQVGSLSPPRMSGALRATLAAHGRLGGSAAHQRDLLHLPLVARVKITPARADIGWRRYSLRGVTGGLTVRYRPGRLGVRSRLRAAELRSAGLAARDVVLPLRAHLTPSRIVVTGRPRARRLHAGDATGWQPAVALSLTSGVDGARLLRRKASALSALKARIVARGERLLLANGQLAYEPRLELRVTGHDGDDLPLAVRLRAHTRRLTDARRQIGRAQLELTGRIGGLALAIPPRGVDAKKLRGTLQLAARARRLTLGSNDLAHVGRTALDLRAQLSRGLELSVPQLSLRVPSHGVRLHGRAQISLATDPRRRELPPFRARLVASVDLPRLRKAAGSAFDPDEKLSGTAGLTVRVERLRGDLVEARGRVHAKDVVVVRRLARRVARVGRSTTVRSSRLSLRGLQLDMPWRQRLAVRWPLSVQLADVSNKRDAAVRRTRQLVYDDLRFVTPYDKTVRFDEVVLEEQVTSTVAGQPKRSRTRRFEVGPSTFDLYLRDGALQLSRIATPLLGGDVRGSARVVLTSLSPPDLRIATALSLGRLDLARLDPETNEPALFSGQAKLLYRVGAQRVDGNASMHEVSRRAIVTFLRYLDPTGVHPKIHPLRETLEAFYVRMLLARIDRAKLRVFRSLANLDLRIGAIWPIGLLLRRLFRGVRVRGFDVQRLLPDLGHEAAPQKTAPAAGADRGTVARRVDYGEEEDHEPPFGVLAARRRAGVIGVYQGPPRGR